LGQPDPILSRYPLYLALATEDAPRREAYRALFRTALNQNQPVGSSRVYAKIEAMTSQQRELRNRRRPRKENQNEPLADTRQQVIPR
jgi:putative transposase